MTLHHICQELTRENVSDFLFLCEHIIPRSRREQIKDPRDLLYVLEQLEIVGPRKLRFLSSVLAEIHRHDLAQKVEEHCQTYGIQRLEDDNAVLPGTAGVVSPSPVLSILPRDWQESPNEVVTYNPARVLEPDDAVPVIPPSQRVFTAELSNTRTAHDPLVMYSDPQTDIDWILRNIEEEVSRRGMPASDEEDMPCYDMRTNPRGNVYTALCKLLLILLLHSLFFYHNTTIYGPFSGITPVSQCQKRTSGLYGARED